MYWKGTILGQPVIWEDGRWTGPPSIIKLAQQVLSRPVPVAHPAELYPGDPRTIPIVMKGWFPVENEETDIPPVTFPPLPEGAIP